MTRAGVVIVAAGSGARFAHCVDDTPAPGKAFALLGARSLLAHCITAFEAVSVVGEIVVVLRGADVARFLDTAAPGRVPVRNVVGGERRQDSVREGLRAIGDACDVVLVHDAARPLVQPAMIQRCVDALTEHNDGVIPVLPVVDTLKRTRDGVVEETVDRATLVRAQTPQAFRRDALVRAYAQSDDADATDDAQLVERAGGRVRCVTGDPTNIKITYPEDLALAEALLQFRAESVPR